jgi:hypothetical protein
MQARLCELSRIIRSRRHLRAQGLPSASQREALEDPPSILINCGL